MDPKWSVSSKKLTTVLASVGLLAFEVALVAVLVRNWLALSGLSRFWDVYLGVSFAMLWFCQLREKGKIACMLWTCLASLTGC